MILMILIVCVKDLEEKSVTFCFPRFKAKKK